MWHVWPEAVSDALDCLRVLILGLRPGGGLSLWTHSGLILQGVLAPALALLFFLGSLSPFTRGLKTDFVRSFLIPTPVHELKDRYASPAFTAPDGWGFPGWMQRLGQYLMRYVYFMYVFLFFCFAFFCPFSLSSVLLRSVCVCAPVR